MDRIWEMDVVGGGVESECGMQGGRDEGLVTMPNVFVVMPFMGPWRY